MSSFDAGQSESIFVHNLITIEQKIKKWSPPLPPPNLFNLQKAPNSCKVKGLSLKQIKQIFLEGESLN